MKQKIIINCNKSYCLEKKEITWKGEFLDKWYCPRHIQFEEKELRNKLR